MKLIICLCLVVVAAAAPAESPSQFSFAPDDVRVLRYENSNDGSGLYRYAFEQSDGTRQEQRGQLKNGSIAVEGVYSWIAPNGIQYNVTYTADAENGFRPEIEEGPGAVPGNVLASALG